jgi:hypothetical protein
MMLDLNCQHSCPHFIRDEGRHSAQCGKHKFQCMDRYEIPNECPSKKDRYEQHLRDKEPAFQEWLDNWAKANL